MLPNIHSKIHFNFLKNSFSQETSNGHQTFVAKLKQEMLVVPYNSFDHYILVDSSMFKAKDIAHIVSHFQSFSFDVA
jgi:hypothetical protein